MSLLNKISLTQFIKYFFTGATAAIVDVSSFVLFASVLNIYYLIAVFFSFTLGTLTNFFICNYYVFKRGDLPLWVAGVRHYFSSIGGLIVNWVVMIFLIEILSFQSMFLSKVIATGCAFIVNFLLIKFFAFNSNIKIFK